MLKKIKKALVIGTYTVMGFNLVSILPVSAQGMISEKDQPSRIADATGGADDFRTLAQTFLSFFLGFLGFIAVMMIIYAGILYITAQGEQDKVDKAKKIITYSVVGILIILLSYAIVSTILGGVGAGSDQ